jgi:hypothetical protein
MNNDRIFKVHFHLVLSTGQPDFVRTEWNIPTKHVYCNEIGIISVLTAPLVSCHQNSPKKILKTALPCVLRIIRCLRKTANMSSSLNDSKRTDTKKAHFGQKGYLLVTYDVLQWSDMLLFFYITQYSWCAHIQPMVSLSLACHFKKVQNLYSILFYSSQLSYFLYFPFYSILFYSIVLYIILF